MDKLSFYMNVDVEQIPMLKNALIESGIWATKQMIDEANDYQIQYNEKKTFFVKDFFQKLETRELPLLDENNFTQDSEFY
jgi:hypothetical protein